VEKAGFSEVKDGSRSKMQLPNLLGSLFCHCEERDSSLCFGTGSAISVGTGDCHASLTMTKSVVLDDQALAEVKNSG